MELFFNCQETKEKYTTSDDTLMAGHRIVDNDQERKSARRGTGQHPLPLLRKTAQISRTGRVMSADEAKWQKGLMHS